MNVEVSPPSKRVMPTEDEEMQPTSEETTITGEVSQKRVMVHMCMCSCTLITYPHMCVYP